MYYVYSMYVLCLYSKRAWLDLLQLIMTMQVCENIWIRIIVGVKRADKRRMDNLRAKEFYEKSDDE